MLRPSRIVLMLAGCLFVVGTTHAQTPSSPAASAQAPARNDYGKADAWLCRPGRKDACAVDLTPPVISASGKLTREEWTPNPAAPIDCFYVYPTVSNDRRGGI